MASPPPDHNCSRAVVIASTISTLFAVLSLATVIYAGYRLSRSRSYQNLLFLTTTAICIAIYPVWSWEICIGLSFQMTIWHWIILYLWFWSWQTQYVLLGLLYFNKVAKIFADTTFAISSSLKTVYHVTFIILTSYMIITVSLGLIFSISTGTLPFALLLLGPLYFLWWSLCMISIVILFIKKLIAVYKMGANACDNNEALIGAITKVSILTMISVFISFVNIIFAIIAPTANIPRIFADWIGLIDIYTNFVNLMLSDKEFTDYYNKICSWIDLKCRHCWSSLINGNKKESINLSEYVASQQSQNTETSPTAVTPSNTIH